MRDIGRNKTRFWSMVALTVLSVAIGAIAAHAALEGQKTNAAPKWLGMFSAAIRPSDGTIFVVGSKALMMTSSDHGKTWLQRTLTERPGDVLFQDRDLYSIRFTPDSKLGLIVGEDGVILRSTDGGETWTPEKSGVKKNLLKVHLVDDQNAMAVGADGVIVRTTDGGQTWNSIKSPKSITLFDITFTDKNTGWAVGEFSTVLKSTDAGQTWNVVAGGNTTDFTIGPYFTINFIDPQHAVVGGLAGEMATSDDGGKTWKPSKLPDPVGAYAATYDPATKKLWAVGTGGRAFFQSAGGQWQEANRDTFNDLTDIALEGNQGVMVGLNGTILVSNDAGEQWQAVQ